MPKKRKRVVLARETEPEPEEEIQPPRVRESTGEKAKRLPPLDRAGYETMERIFNRFITEYQYNESESKKFVDNIMEKYPFDREKEQMFIHEEIEKYYEEMDKKLRLTPSPPVATAPPTAAPPTPAPPTDASPQLNQAFNALRDTLELIEDDPDAQLKAKHSKSKKKIKSKRRKTKRKVSKRRKTKRKKKKKKHH